jgi:TrmH family RNA methyltransferase
MLRLTNAGSYHGRRDGSVSPVLRPLKWYKSLSTKKGRLSAGAFIVEGERAVSQVMAAGPGSIQEILSIENPPDIFRRYRNRLLTESQFRSISNVAAPQGLMAVVQSPPDIYSDRLPAEPGDRILLLEDIQDPGNAGTLIRTAAAFGYSGVIMTDNCTDPLSPKCVQSTAGSVLSVWIRRTAGCIALIDALRETGYTLIAAVLDGKEDLTPLKQSGRLVLALGNEAAGLSGEVIGRADYRIRIPTVAKKAESLNVAACGAICMFFSVRRQKDV